MKDYRANGGLKRRTAVALAACFLMGSSITSLAAGDGVADAYQGLADSTSVWNTYAESGVDIPDVIDDETLEWLSKEWDIDPEKLIIMDDGIEAYSGTKEVYWEIEPGYTCMTAGFSQAVGDEVLVVVYGTPDEVEYRTGLKDPKRIMWYVEGSGTVYQDFEIKIKGRHYFFVSNMSETEDLVVEAYLHRIDAADVAQ